MMEDNKVTISLAEMCLEHQKIGRKQVVDWVDIYDSDGYCRISNHTPFATYQAQLKKWGIDGSC